MTITKEYQIQTIEKENQGRHRILLYGGIQPEYDAKAIRTLLARHLYKEMKQKPAFIFVYDRPEDLHNPLGFTVARLVLPIDGKKYTVEVRDRSGLDMPSDEEFRTYDYFQEKDRSGIGSDYAQTHIISEDSPTAQKVNRFLYHAPLIRFEVSA